MTNLKMQTVNKTTFNLEIFQVLHGVPGNVSELGQLAGVQRLQLLQRAERVRRYEPDVVVPQVQALQRQHVLVPVPLQDGHFGQFVAGKVERAE